MTTSRVESARANHCSGCVDHSFAWHVNSSNGAVVQAGALDAWERLVRSAKKQRMWRSSCWPR